MSLISSKRKQILAGFEFKFEPSDSTYYSSATTTIYYDQAEDVISLANLLHEIGHAQLGHSDFKSDIDLIKMERQAWQVAADLGRRYDIAIDEDIIESALDSYRDWLHSRSRCPNCSLAGIQGTDGDYRCLICRTNWRVNDARNCGLKRYQKNNL